MHYVLKCACEYLSTACSFFISPTLKNSVACITNKCLDNTISGGNAAKRLQRKNLRRFGRYRRRRKNIKCHYTSNEHKEPKSDQKMRVAESDFLANLAYNHRISKTAETSNVVPADVPNSYIDDDEVTREIYRQGRQKDHRDLYFIIYLSYIILIWITCFGLKYVFNITWHMPGDLKQTSKSLKGEQWWAKMQEYAAQMPPLEHDTAHLTTSDCSVCHESDFGTPETILKSSSPLRKRTSKLNGLKRSFVRDKRAVHYSQSCEGTKSDSKIDSARRGKFDLDVAKSASTKTMKRRISLNKRKNSSARKARLKKLRRSLL